MTATPRKPLLVNMAWAGVLALLLAVGYVLSYAPASRSYMVRHEMRWSAADGNELPVYRPVDWLIDHTPLRRPLFLWARLWGMERAFNWAWSQRLRNRSREPLTNTS